MKQVIESRFGVVEDRTNDLIETAREVHEDDLDCNMCQADLKTLSKLDYYAGYVLNALDRIVKYFKND